jgi:hypothetical protein
MAFLATATDSKSWRAVANCWACHCPRRRLPNPPKTTATNTNSSPVLRYENARSVTKGVWSWSKFSWDSTGARRSSILHDNCSRLRTDVPTGLAGPSQRGGVAAPPCRGFRERPEAVTDTSPAHSKSAGGGEHRTSLLVSTACCFAPRSTVRFNTHRPGIVQRSSPNHF